MICQVCYKPGHSAKKCYHRFDVTYRDNAAKSNNLHGLMATTSTVSATDWHPDTGATHHLTCRTSENPRGVGWRFFCLRFALIGSLESPPSNLLKATSKPDVLVLSDIRG